MKNLVDDESICDVSMPYVKLWRAALVQAIEDAIKPGGIDTLRERLEKEKSRQWILENRSDFKQVCQLACLPHEPIRKYVLTKSSK